MRAARELVERAAHGASEHTYGVNTGFGRFVSQSIPRGADGGAAAAPAAQPRLRRRRSVPGRDRARRDAAARERAREGLLGRARSRPSSCSSSASTAASCRTSRAAARSAPAATSRRSRTSRSRCRRGRGAGSTGERLPGRRGARARRARADRARGEGRALARQRHPVHGRVRRARRRPRARRLAQTADIACALSLEALQGSRDELPPADPRAAPARGPERLGGERPPPARGLGDHRGAPLVRQGAGRVLAALRAAGARRHARPARLRRERRSRSS